MHDKTCYITLTTISGEILYNDKNFCLLKIFKKLESEIFKKYNIISMKIVLNKENDLKAVNEYTKVFFKKCSICLIEPQHSLKIRLLKNDKSLGIFLNIPTCCGYSKCEDFLKDVCLFFNKIFKNQSFFTISSQPEIFTENFFHELMTLSELRENETFIRRIKVL